MEVIPEFMKIPPQDPEYQFQVAESPVVPPENVNVDEFPEHI